MASAFGHAAVPLALGAAFHRKGDPPRLWVLAVFCALAPDLDVLGFWAGVPYGSPFGHRGFSHSLLFAALLAMACLAALPPERRGLRPWSWLFLAAASHGLLDAMTTGGMGVGFFIPFDNARIFLPWRPIRVSPLAPAAFFGARGLMILRNELLWIWAPCLVLAGACLGLRRASPRP